MADSIRILDPAGHTFVQEVALARRPRSLAGLRPGVLENKKANARLLMESMVDGLRGRISLGPTTTGSKPVAAGPSKETVELLRRQTDFVVVGSSD